ncbi:MAG TPA: M20/M25/M40 family metallo-hydrolase [Gemmatimonadales bacterium]|nr:M20/M25/M40 family metallo-hydrolase [Gemmatimonadales bacterium]
MRVVTPLLAAAFAVAGCRPVAVPASSPEPASQPALAVSTAAMDAHLKYLADDLLEGRAPATRGGELAMKYIAAQFEALGLEPAGKDGSYYQPVALVGMVPHPTLVWGRGAGARPLEYLDEFVAWAERPEPHIVADADLVFVGYGIQAAEWRWDDYKDVDVRGKVLLMLVNDPGLQDSTVFNGRALTYYGRWTYKLEEAARRGAIGAILVHTTESATYGWDVVRSSWSVEQFKLDQPAPLSLAFAAWVTHDAAQAALAQTGLSLDSLTRAAAHRAFRPAVTGVHVVVDISSRLRHVRSANVLARVAGSDPTLARQAVLLTAHWDHKGIGPAVNGDSIYNGAEDNASGVAAMLAAAQAAARLGPRPRRTLLFVATTAEESGLLGSEAYVRDPLVPLDQTAAVLNLDVTNVRGATRDIDALGGDRSTLGSVFAAVARSEALAVVHEPDVRGSFYRSDHFPFAKAGVPAISIQPGTDFVGRPTGWGREQAALYNRTRYHQPNDEYRSEFSYDGMAQEVRVALGVALAVANAQGMPQWLPNSEFHRPMHSSGP